MRGASCRVEINELDPCKPSLVALGVFVLIGAIPEKEDN